MVKGISRQVIVVQSKDKKLFDQAIFILSDSASRQEGVTDDALLREANELMRHRTTPQTRISHSILCAVAGAIVSCVIWAVVSLL